MVLSDISDDGAPAPSSDIRHQIVFYSGGKASWLTAFRVKEFRPEAEITLLFTDTKVEDAALYRFLDAGAAGAVDVVLRRMIEERLGVGAGKGQRLQVRAPDGGAVDGIMDARVAPDGPEDTVLDVIEAQRLTPDIQ